MAYCGYFPSIRRMTCVFTLMVLATGTAMRADNTKTDNLSCDGEPVSVADRQYQQEAGDVLEPRHLEIARPFTGTGSLNVSVCNAQLRVRTRPDAKDLKVSVELGDKSDKPAADYIHILRVVPDNGVIHLKFPNNSHAVVTLTVPMNKGLESQFNLGKGDLNFDAIGSAGERQINVGYGHAKLLVEGDKSYSDMQVNIGMGSLHDHRPGGHDGHFVVSKSYSGSGVGSLQVNVGMGSLDIAQE
jgi:hypothetical protein